MSTVCRVRGKQNVRLACYQECPAQDDHMLLRVSLNVINPIKIDPDTVSRPPGKLVEAQLYNSQRIDHQLQYLRKISKISRA
jgi:hypothetical protein